jgi:diguanylate cyclase (GGDEF)-like protein
MWVLAGFISGGLWIWDYVIDPAGAQHTIGLRLIMALIPLFVAFLIVRQGIPVPLRKVISIVGVLLVNLVFFFVLARVQDGMIYGIGGYMFFQMGGFLLWMGMSFRLIFTFHLLVAALPQLLGLAFPEAGFLQLRYAVLLWPATIMAIFAQYALYREYMRSYSLRQEMKKLATTDPLTGALNRRSFYEQAEELINLGLRHQNPTAALMIDIDHFKRVNDSYGHPAGDRVLQAVAATIGDALRSTDLLSRWGGEEFVALLPQTDQAQALKVAKRILQAVREKEVTLDSGETLVCTVSIGLATLQARDRGVDGLISKADTAMYRAKLSGRDQLQY